jgi:DNA-binding transcriptional MerR regulator
LRDLDIAEVSKRSGVPASALRFYEEKGVIASIGRRGLRRLFDPAVLEQLAIVGVARAAGFTLEEISRMFTPTGHPEIPRDMLMLKADELNLKIRKLTALRDGLRHAAECTAPSHMECPKFQRILRKGALRARTGSV